jgi:citrate synthase
VKSAKILSTINKNILCSILNNKLFMADKKDKPQPTGGLAGVIAGDSAISTVGLGVGLNYRGYSIEDLSENCIFEEVLHLLIFKHLPTQEELK